MAYINYLANFICVYREQSLAKASEKIGLTTAALSKQIKSLESRLGYPLFVRKANKLLPTEKAHALSKEVSDSVDILDRAVSIGHSIKEDVNVAVDCIHNHIMRDQKLYDFISEHEVKISIASTFIDRKNKGLEEKHIDFAISPHCVDSSHISHDLIFKEKYILVGNKSAYEQIKTISEEKGFEFAVSSSRWVLTSNEWGDLTEQLLSTRLNGKVEIKSIMNIKDDRILLDLVCQGRAISILPEKICRPLIEAGELFQLGDEAFVIPFYLQWRNNFLNHPTNYEIYALIKELFSKLA